MAIIKQIEPWLNNQEKKQLIKVIDSTWISEGKMTSLFAQKISKLTKAKYVLPTTSGTVALYLSLLALGIKKDDEVIVPDFTFIASSNSVLLAGAKPVFVDVDKNYYNLDPVKIEEKITKKTRAIMPVHIYGQSAPMNEIIRIAKKHNLLVIEDAAQGIGVFYDGKHLGTLGDIGIISFYANKVITTGEGGVILTNNKKLYEKVYSLSHEGRRKGDYNSFEIGYNFCFTEMQAAIGLIQLKKLPKIIEKKKEIWQKYFDGLKNVKEIKFCDIDPKSSSNYWMTNILVNNPQGLADYLKKSGILTRRFFPPLHNQPCYEFMKIKNDYPVSQYIYQHGLSLPSSVLLINKEIHYVCQKIKDFFRKTNQ